MHENKKYKRMKNDILEHKKAVVENIYKSFGENIDIQKAHYHGEIHKNGKWYWNSNAAGGKGDWRVIKKKKGEAKKEPDVKTPPVTKNLSREDKIKKIAKEFLDSMHPNFDTLYKKYGFESSVNEYNRVRNEVAKIINKEKEQEKEKKLQNDKKILRKMLKTVDKDSQKIHFEDGKAVVTDGFVLLAMDFDYPEELENQTTDKNLKPIKTSFPDWKTVISPKQKERLNVDPKKIFEATNKIKKILGLKITGIKIGDEYYRADDVNQILSIEPNVKIYKDKYGNLVLENDNFRALKTSLRKDKVEADNERFQNEQGDKMIYTIEEALKYEPKPVIKFKEGKKTLNGKIIGSFTVGNNKFDIVYEPKDDSVYSVFNNKAVEYTYTGKGAKERLIERTKEKLKYLTKEDKEELFD